MGYQEGRMLKAIISSLTVPAAPRGGSGQGQDLGLPLATTPGLLAAVCGAGSSPGPWSPAVCSSLSLAAPGVSPSQMACRAPAPGSLGCSVCSHGTPSRSQLVAMWSPVVSVQFHGFHKDLLLRGSCSKFPRCALNKNKP